jgi:hypothetical protein
MKTAEAAPPSLFEAAEVAQMPPVKPPPKPAMSRRPSLQKITLQLNFHALGPPSLLRAHDTRPAPYQPSACADNNEHANRRNRAERQLPLLRTASHDPICRTHGAL